MKYAIIGIELPREIGDGEFLVAALFPHQCLGLQVFYFGEMGSVHTAARHHFRWFLQVKDVVENISIYHKRITLRLYRQCFGAFNINGRFAGILCVDLLPKVAVLRLECRYKHVARYEKARF